MHMVMIGSCLLHSCLVAFSLSPAHRITRAERMGERALAPKIATRCTRVASTPAYLLLNNVFWHLLVSFKLFLFYFSFFVGAFISFRVFWPLFLYHTHHRVASSFDMQMNQKLLHFSFVYFLIFFFTYNLHTRNLHIIDINRNSAI